MTKIKKIGKDGKEHEYVKLDKKDIKKRKEQFQKK